MAKIKDIIHAPLVECLVKDKDSDEIFYQGDSSYEAQVAEKQARAKGIATVYEKKTTPLVSEKDKQKGMHAKEQLILYGDLIKKVPKRISHIYGCILSGIKVDDSTILLAMKFHPEYF